MALDSYSNMQTSIADWLDRDDLVSKVQDFISLAEARINRTLRVRGIEDRAVTSLVPGQEYYSLPSDFLTARNIQINTNPIIRLVYKTPQQMDYDHPNSASGTPSAYTIIGNELQIKPIPSTTDQLEIGYFVKLDPLSDTNETNWLTENAPDLLLYGSLIEAEAYLINDPRLGVWKAAFDLSMTEWNTSEDKARHSGSVLQIRGTTTES